MVNPEKVKGEKGFGDTKSLSHLQYIFQVMLDV